MHPQHPLEVKGHQTRGPLAVDVQTHGAYCPRLLLKKRCGGETVSEQTVLCYATVRSAFVFMAMQS